MSTTDMTGKTCVVTGASFGLGRETALELARRGAQLAIIDIVRAEETARVIQERTPNARVDLLVADLSSQEQVRGVAEQLNRDYERIDVLVNNAGRHLMRRETSVDGFEMNLALNCLGPYLLTNLLLDKLEASAPARVVNVASEAHRVPGRFAFDDLNTEQETMLYAYGKSKIANILWAKALARRLKGRGVSVNAVCPGVVATKIFDNYLPRWFSAIAPLLARLGLLATAKQGARMQIKLASDPAFAEVSGHFFPSHPLMKLFAPQKRTLDISLQEKVWATAAELTGLTPS